MRKSNWVKILAPVLLVVLLLIFSGCSTTQTPTSATAATTTTTSSTSGTSSTTPPAPAQTVKIGLVGNLSGSVTIDWMRSIEAQVTYDNKQGGINVGGTKYQVQTIRYDAGTDQTTEVAAVNRLVFQDNAKYIITEGNSISSWLPVTEQNKVIVFAQAPPAQMNLTPNFQYSYNGSILHPARVAVFSWYFKDHPEAKNSVVMAYPDSPFGHQGAMVVAAGFAPIGVKSTDLFFPESMQDFSSFGTKVASLNSAIFGVLTQGDNQTGQVLTAVRQAGYKGAFITSTIYSTPVLLSVMSQDALEGFISPSLPTEFDPPLTEVAKQFKDIFINTTGAKELPNYGMATPYWILKTAFSKAGSIDTDKIKAVLDNNLTFESPMGPGQMIARPDLGNNKSVDTVGTYYIKKVHNGKAELIKTITVEEASATFKVAFPPSTAGAGPSGPPPGGGAQPPPAKSP